MMIQDDYEPWANHKKNTIYGKPMIVDQTDYETLQIFFDDNINSSEKCIVDCRDLISGKSLPILPSTAAPNQPYLSRFMVQVDIIAAILKKARFAQNGEVARYPGLRHREDFHDLLNDEFFTLKNSENPHASGVR